MALSSHHALVIVFSRIWVIRPQGDRKLVSLDCNVFEWHEIRLIGTIHLSLVCLKSVNLSCNIFLQKIVSAALTVIAPPLVTPELEVRGLLPLSGKEHIFYLFFTTQ